MAKLIVECRETSVSRYAVDLSKQNFKIIQEWLSSDEEYGETYYVDSIEELQEMISSDDQLAFKLYMGIHQEIQIKTNHENDYLGDSRYQAVLD